MSDNLTSEPIPSEADERSPLLHRLAVLSVCLVWPLIWVGGLVTTYDAGMAVPDWPGTYGYNLFLYPLSTWLFGHLICLSSTGTVCSERWSGWSQLRWWSPH